ncbi:MULTISPECIES: YkgJ family cysteine cluster protein [Citrobacter]|uniref:YkgJ family cysteine cluster protein n=1 Tax=Citrobacter TaxID=544 RepID=UPI002930E9C4|nr:YkgJ family cysteine cluster protein [Citrobacter farmeri]HCB3267213.1 YkgJ family cysteine cluster protein [Citrobacter amalonaticus]
MSLEKLLIKNRKCGSCSVCCTSLRIEQPTLKKLADVPCQHLKPQGGCSIYDERPSVCRTWYCGWRILDIGPEMRPDRSGVLIRYDGSSLCFQPVDKNRVSALIEPEPLRILGGLVAQGMKVEISVPTKEGYCSSNINVTEHMSEVVKSREYAKMRSALLAAIQFASQSKTDPVEPLE